MSDKTRFRMVVRGADGDRVTCWRDWANVVDGGALYAYDGADDGGRKNEVAFAPSEWISSTQVGADE